MGESEDKKVAEPTRAATSAGASARPRTGELSTLAIGGTPAGAGIAGILSSDSLEEEAGTLAREELASSHVAIDEVEEIELDLLLEGIYRRYGFDFREYARASLRRRVWNTIQEQKLGSISSLQERVLRDSEFMEKFLLNASVSVTSMFRDPSFYAAMRQKVIPLLRSFPYVRIWHAGCATGEEVYSTAILLEEEGLLDRCRIYATDMNELALQKAKEGIFPLGLMQEYSVNYLKAGGAGSLSNYFTARYDHVIFRANLKRNMLFAHHNLVTDGSFNEFNLILCRNVMIYFNETLQTRVHRLLYDSMRRLGVLCLGRSESMRGTPHLHEYEEVDGREKIYRKVK